MRKIFRWFGLTAFLAFLLAGRLPAQSYQDFSGQYDAIIKNARFHLGPFRIFPRIQLKNIGYDDNLFFESTGRVAADYTATLSPEVLAYFPFRGKMIFWVRENPEYVYYLEESAFRGWTNSTSAGGRGLLFSRFVLAWEYGFSKYRRPVSSELPVPAKDYSKGWTANVFYETARQTYFGLTAGIRSIGYEDVKLFDQEIRLSRVFDREERFAGFEFYYRLFSDSHFFLSARREDFRFRYDEASSRDALAAIVQSGIRFPLLGRVRGLLSVGYKSFRPKDRTVAPFSGLIGNTGVEANMGRVGARLAYGRDIVFSYDRANAFYIDQNFGPGVSVYLTDFIRIGYNLNIGWASYPVSGPTSGEDARPGDPRRDRRFSYSAEIAVRVYRTYGLGLSINSTRWKSEAAAFDRGRTFIGVNLISRF